jgi:hypothetical protein
MSPTYAWSLQDVAKAMQQVEGAFTGTPPHLFVPAVLLLAHGMVTGRTLEAEEMGKFVGDMVALMQTWKQEVMN